MSTPGFTAEKSLYQGSAQYYGRSASGQNGVAVGQAIKLPPTAFDCSRFPGLCVVAPAINVSWVPFGNGVSGLVIVTGRDFTPNTEVKVDIGNCLGGGGGSLVKFLFTDTAGEFTTWGTCDCKGTTTVNAVGLTTSDTAQGTAALMPC